MRQFEIYKILSKTIIIIVLTLILAKKSASGAKPAVSHFCVNIFCGKDILIIFNIMNVIDKGWKIDNKTSIDKGWKIDYRKWKISKEKINFNK